MASEEALALLRRRLCDPSFVHSAFKSSPNGNYCKLKFLISNTIAEAFNNSVLLLGPRGSGKGAVVDLVLEDLKAEFPDIISVVRLNGVLHVDDSCALKEIARQLCMEHKLLFSKMVSFDDNSEFMIDMLRECGLAHKTIIFVLDEFDLFTQGKQQLLYTLLDAMQSLNSQSIIIGVSCRLNLLGDKMFKDILDSLSNVDSTISNILRFLYLAISSMNLESGLLTMDNLKSALSCIQRQPMLDKLKDASILELYTLVCMNRLESREQNSYNYNSVMKEYKAIQDAYKTSDNYSRSVCLRAFEHLLERELISFTNSRTRSQSIEFRPVRLLLSSQELHQGLKLNASCPAILQKLLNHESYR